MILNIVYLGTPDFAVKPLAKILDDGRYNVIAVVTNRDKPVGRKQILTPPPVKEFALQRGVKVLQYDKIRLEGVDDLKSLNPDLMVTCAFGQILSEEILNIPKFGVINIHASLLPELRGASPIHYAIKNGYKKTGVTIMKTDIGIDTGDMILKEEIDILENETCGELFERLSDIGAGLIVKALPTIFDGSAKYEKQDDEKATYTKIIKKEMAKIDWNDTAENIVNQVRAFNPSPVAFTFFEGQPFKVYQAKKCELKGQPQEILKADTELVIGCKDFSVSLIKVQKSGGKPMPIADFLRGNKLKEHEDFC